MNEKAKILVAEDEFIIAKDMATMLENVGYEVAAIVATGEEAIEKSEEERPDLVLMDIMLSGKLDGIATEKIIQGEKGIPVIYLTAHSDESTLQRAKATEPYAYLLKPFGERELRITIEMALKRHQVEEALRESEERYRLLFLNANEGIMTLDTRGRVVDVNPRFVEICGYQKDEIVGLGLLRIALLLKVSAKEVVSKFKGFLSGKMQRSNWTITKNNGAKSVISVFPSKISKDSKFLGISVLVVEATNIAQLENALLESEEKYKKLFEAAGDAIFLMNESRFVDCNAMTMQIFGCTYKDQILNKNLWDFSPLLQPDGKPSKETALAFMNDTKNGETQRFLWTHLKIDGTPFDAEVTLSRLESGDEISFLAIVRDISERKS